MRLRAMASRLAEFCYPGSCEVCARSTQSAAMICGECEAQLKALGSAPACDRCGMPLFELDAPCPHCLGKGVPHYERVIRLGVFDDPIKHLIHRLKYNGRWPLAEFFAERMVAHEPAKGLLHETQVIVPIPLHPWRQIKRGYNQSELIARKIAKLCKVEFAQPLVRVRATETQTHLHSHAKRQENLRDAFALDDARHIAGKHVTLIDDVMTTGATLQSAARVLEQAKPESLSVLVVAIADPKHRDFEVI
jgi:ComF family protein